MKPRPKAFTLVELLVALAISSVLILMLVKVVSATLSAWEQGRNQIDTLATSRQALGRIADEIKGAIASAAPNQIEFSENVTALQGTTPPVPGISENVFFVAPFPNSAAGDLCVIAYRHNSDTHELQRAFVDSLNSWSAAQKYRSGGYASLQWRTVAKGVLEFEIQSYSQTDLDSASPTPAPAQWNSVSGTAVMLGSTPREVVVRMKVIDEKALARIAGLSAGNSVYDRTVLHNAREFTAGVPLAH